MSDTENTVSGTNSYPGEVGTPMRNSTHSPHQTPDSRAKVTSRAAKAHRPATSTDSPKHAKRRKTESKSMLKNANDTRGSSDWQLHLYSGSDETLQISRVTGTENRKPRKTAATDNERSPTSNHAISENALDSYRLETLASAERPFNDVTEEPMEQRSLRWCDATLSANLIAITAGNLVYILSSNCKSQVATIRHDTRILITALSCDSSFVAFGDDAGMLFIVHIETRKPVFSQAIKTPDSRASGKSKSPVPFGISALRFSTPMTLVDDGAREELVLTTTNDTMVRFSGIQLSLLSKAIVDGNMELATSIKDEIRVEFVSLVASKRSIHNGGVNGLSVFHSHDRSHIVVAGDGDACMSCWERVESTEKGEALSPTKLVDIVTTDCSGFGAGYSKILLSLDHRYIVALSEHGTLDVYECSTLTLVFRYSEIDIDDFSLLAPGSSNSKSTPPTSILVALISKPVLLNEEDASDSEDPSEEALCRRLLVVSLPTANVIYSMDVSEWSWLAHDTRSSNDIADSILFVEGTARYGVQSFFLRSLNETVPLERLTHFLRAGRYAEAETFAENCNIPLSLVYRKRIEELLNGDLPRTGAGSRLDENEPHLYAENVLDLLEHIDDVDFAIESCVRMPCPSYAGAQKLLEYARSLAAKSAPASVPRILNTIQRLGTWSMVSSSVVHSIQSNIAYQGGGFDPDTWHAFRTGDLASYLRSYVAQGDMQSLGAVWRRHRDDKRLCADISSAVQGFSMDIDTHSLVCWLRTEVFPSLSARQQWHEIAVWTEQRTRALASKRNRITDALLLANLLDIRTWSADFGKSSSSSDSSGTESFDGSVCSPVCGPFAVTPQNFIENSIYAARWAVELARVSGVSVFSAQSETSASASSDSALQSCLFLRKQLLDLVYLREKHNMVLTLEEFEQLSYSAIATELLDRVGAPELLNEAYFAHFVPYSEHHQLDFAQALREYCIEMMDAVQRDGTDNGSAAGHGDGDDNNDDDGGISLAALSVPGSIGRQTWEPRVLALLSCLYSSCIGRSGRAALPAPVGSDGASSCNPRFPPLTSSRIGLLTTYSELILEVMRRSSIPWSSSIDSAIANTTSLLSHYASMDAEISRCQHAIKDQFRLMCLKRMLLSHGLADFHISNTKMAYPLLQWLVRKTDDESIMTDVLQLVDVYHHLSRTSAYVLRLQVLCETSDSERAAALMTFIDATEYSTGADTAIQRYRPMEVARRGICWIREVLDNMPFGESVSRVQFRQLVGAALAIIRALKELAHRYSRIAQSSFGSNGVGGHSRGLASSELRALQEFVDQETSVFSVVWQLLVDGGIMVSPGELDQEHTREQILSELLEQHWLRAYVDQPNSNQLSTSSSGKRGAYKGKGVAANENAAYSSVPRSTRPNNTGSKTPIELLGLPLVPAKIKTLSSMLRFGPVQLGHKIVSKCLSLGLYTMALDMCQQLIESLTPLPHTAAASSASDEWSSAILALVSCERELSAFLANVAAGDVDAANGNGGTSLSGCAQGSLIRCLATVCQAACLKCASHGYLVSFLDAYSCWELAQAIFSQTTDGDFALLTKQVLPVAAPRSSAYLDDSPSCPLASSSSNPAPARNGHFELSAAADPHDGSFSSWLAPLYVNAYAERGLVLETKRAMHLTYRFASALRWLPTAEMCANSRTVGGLSGYIDTHPPTEQSDKAPVLGKMSDSSYGYAKMDEAMLKSLSVEDMRYEVIRRSSDLAAHLAQNRHWVLAVHVFELTVSHLARSSFVAQTSDVSAYSSDAMDELRQRLSTGGVSEDEMSAFFTPCDSETSPLIDIQTLISKSLQRSLQQRGIDAVFIFSSMLMEPPAKAYQYLSTAMSHAGLLPSRVIALANIGAACSLVWQQQALLDRCRAVAAAARWTEQLQLLQLNFDVALLNDPKPELLEPLVRPMLLKTGMDITTLLEFAEAFRLDETFVVLEYILLCCSVDDVDGYQARILGIASEVANTKLLERTYIDALENGICTYDYERLQFVVQRLHELRPQDKVIEKYSAVLDILCSYDRHSQPTHEELLVEQSRTNALQDTIRQARSADSEPKDGSWAPATSDGESSAADDAAESCQVLLAKYQLARKRLPFHSLVNTSPWATLLPELSVETVEMLLPLSGPLELSEDDFYMNLIDSMLKKWKADNALAEGTNDSLTAYEVATNKTPTHFNTIQQLVRCFKDPESAISTIKHLADELPCGPDRIAALKLGMKLLYKWGQYIRRMPEPDARRMMPKAETIYFHFEKSYAYAQTEITLRRNGLEKYLSLFLDVHGGTTVINALAVVFEGECERATHEPSKKGKEALHITLHNLASIYDIGISTLTEKLLNRYLEAAVVCDKGSEWLELPSTRYQATLRLPSSQEAVIRRRIVYILRIYPAADAVKYMMDFAYTPKGGIACLNRARALAILFSFASREEISQLQAPESVHKYFQALLYLADFEHVGIPQSTADFLDCDKAALARSIWVDNHEDPKVVQLVCNMCLDFMVHDCDLLLRILPRLLDAGKHFYVVNVLSAVSSLSCYSSIAELSAFWNQAALGSLLHLVQKTDVGWIEDAFSILGLCVRSRYLPEIDTNIVVRLLLQKAERQNSASGMRRFQLACAVLDAFPRAQSTEQLFLAYIGNMEPKQIHGHILGILELSNAARTSTQGAQLFIDWETARSLSLIFDYLDSNDIHEQVLLHPPLGKAVHAFVQNRIRQDKLVNAVNVCLERNKRQVATQLVCQYYKTCSAEVLAEDARRAGFGVRGLEEALITGDKARACDSEDNSTTYSLGSETPCENGADDTSIIVRLATRISDQQKLNIYIGSHS
ncbi:hypothetical protein IW140_003140 [Coemansia sp. RSA 1813]|nr:hypothetical protein LPJ74_006295 [Coemansia sp. RSA 1843]KAJ2214555.1 hypothetical protein EV179_002960 [Coemansia sp. RSA 487]KAJ2569437.1 hypothetical protein IW140_003140 [Coemansia sp. RSA 1813]